MKLHLKCVDEPILFGDVVADCGEVVPNAVAAFMFDYESVKECMSLPIRSCQACLKTCQYESRRYLYGIVNGQEAKMEEL